MRDAVEEMTFSATIGLPSCHSFPGRAFDDRCQSRRGAPPTRK